MSLDFDLIQGSVENLPPFILINASAGTGKTWTISNIAARWLLEVDGRSPAHILMVTFGRDAAGELKGRLRDRLEEYQRELEHPKSSEAWASQLAQVAQHQGIDLLHKRCARLLNEIDSLHARTIHSFAATVGSGLEDFVEDVVALRTRACREAITWAVTREPELLLRLFSKIESTGNKSTRLLDQLKESLQVGLPLGGFSAGSLLQLTGISSEMSEEDQISLEFFKILIQEAERRENLLRSLQRASTYDAVIGDLVNEVEQDVDGVRRRLGGQFQFVIIDEFQDTDAAQWDIFSKIFREGPEPVPILVVGDAKQSIYKFRGGDVTIMQRRQSEIERSDTFAQATLNTNYRSHSGLIEHLNAFYCPDDVPHQFVPAGVDPAIAYEKVYACEKLNDRLGLMTIRDVRGISLTADKNEAIRRDLITEIRRLTTDGSSCLDRELPSEPERTRWNYSDIAVLCRTKDFIREIQSDLADEGIPYITPRSLSVFSSRAASQVRLLLWALCNPTDPRRWKTLATSWFAWLTTSSKSPQQLVQLVAKKGVSALQREVTGGTFLQEILGHPGGQRNVTDVEHIFSLIASEFPNGGPLSEVADWVNSEMVNAPSSGDDSDGQRRVESDENAVRLMTIHGSKGLEFPVVLVPNPESGGKGPLLITEHTGSGINLDLSSVIVAQNMRTEKMKVGKVEESDRLIYVALTRAQNVLTAWVSHDHSASKFPAWFQLCEPWLSQQDDESSDDDANNWNPSLPRVMKLTNDSLSDPDSKRTGKQTVQLRDVDVLPIRRSPWEPQHRWSYSSLHAKASESPEEQTDGRSEAEDEQDHEDDSGKNDNRPGYDTFGTLRGTQLGNAVHGAMEACVGQISADDPAALDAVIKQAFSAEGQVAPANAVEVFSRLLRFPLGSAWEDLCLDAYSSADTAVAAEMNFTLPLHPPSSSGFGDALLEICRLARDIDSSGPFVNHFDHLAQTKVPGRLLQGYLNGSIDLVAPTLGEQRRYIVLDYKTNSLTMTKDFSVASLKLEMAASGYPLQALLYSVALHRHLTWRLPGYVAEEHLGGATYFYVRGAGIADAKPGDGIFHWDIPAALTRAVSSLFAGEGS